MRLSDGQTPGIRAAAAARLFRVPRPRVAGYLIVTHGVIPLNGDARPLPLEEWAARASLRANLTRDAPKRPNPVALTDANLISGIGLYAK